MLWLGSRPRHLFVLSTVFNSGFLLTGCGHGGSWPHLAAAFGDLDEECHFELVAAMQEAQTGAKGGNAPVSMPRDLGSTSSAALWSSDTSPAH